MLDVNNRSNRARLAAALVAAAVGTATFASAASGAGAALPGGAAAQVEERMRGEAAIQALGSDLADVARANGLGAIELRERLRTHEMLWVDESGALLFVDEGLTDHAHDAHHAEEPTAATTDSHWTEQPTADAFVLHSRPGADRVIHLDFDGHDPATSIWKDKTVAQPYDTDGDPATFSDDERRAIIEVWQRVAEDFAPFAIDVTTQDPGIDAIRRTTSTDARYGTRVVVTPTATNCESCGGVAYVGTYDAYGGSDSTGWTHDRYQPAWVYLNGASAKSIAEAASHEAGHNLGLYHDGVINGPGYYAGHGDWAPLMGVGYYEPITQWSRGEYAGANNTEDDLSVVASNGGLLAGDDHGGTSATATPLESVVDVRGEIGAGDDVDAFSFTTSGGLLSLSATPVSVGANLDIGLRLLRDTGSTVTTADGIGLGAALEVSLPAGTYVLVVDGVGAGDPATTGYSDYASAGRYRLTGSLPSGGTVENQAPVASLAADPTSGAAPLPVAFDGSGSTDPDGDPLAHSWAFGDGSTAFGTSTTSHTYDAPGTYTVVLTVSDGALASTASATITVTEPTTVVSAPAAPQLSATQASGTVALTWNDDASVATYEVHRETQHRNGSFRSRTLLTTLDGSISTWADEPGSGTFRYLVVARNSGGSTESNPVIETVGSTRTKTNGKGSTRSGTMKIR